jgi:hypothetical protein
MNTLTFGHILVVNSLLIITLNGLFYWQSFKDFFAQPQNALPIGLAIYATQAVITYFLLGAQKPWLTAPFKGKFIIQGLGSMILVYGLTIGLISIFATHNQPVDLPGKVLSFLPVFILNSLPGALIEEWLFRYLPFRFGQQWPTRYRSIIFCIGVLLLSTLLHIPAYIFQYEVDLTELSNVFVHGLFFLTVYLLTQNLVFTALFHGLTNKSLLLVESPSYWLYFYSITLLVSVVWAVINWRRRRNSTTV